LKTEVELFRILYETYFDSIYRSTYLIAQDEFIAKDATQEAFVVAFQTVHKLKDHGRFRNWVAAIASNKAIDMIRKSNRSIPVDNIEHLISEGSPDNPADTVITEETRQELMQVLKLIDVKYREIIALKYYYDLTDEEIGEYLYMPVGTVKSRLHRAKALLRKLLRSKHISEAIL